MTAVYLAAAVVALLAVTWAVVARILRDADPLGDDDAFRQAMNNPNRDNYRDDLGENR
jgi:hypothetical protein